MQPQSLNATSVSLGGHSNSTTSNGSSSDSLSQREQILMRIWCAALGRTQVGIHDNFFDVGGHSLLVVKVLADLRVHFKKPVNLTDLFRYTTIAQLAVFLREEEPESCSDDVSLTSSRFSASKERAKMRLQMRQN